MDEIKKRRNNSISVIFSVLITGSVELMFMTFGSWITSTFRMKCNNIGIIYRMEQYTLLMVNVYLCNCVK